MGKKFKLKRRKRDIFSDFIRWGSLSVFIAATLVIFVESAIPGQQSADQSNSVTDVIQSGINSGYDNEKLIEIKDFNISFDGTLKNKHKIGDKITFSVNYVPANTSYTNLDWEVNDESLINLNLAESTITCLSAGDVKISVKSQRNPEIKKEISFTIDKKPVESVTVEHHNLEMNINDTHLIHSTVLPEDASNKTLIYTSSDNAVVSVDELGLIKAKSAGTAEISIVSEDNPKCQETISILVNETIVEEVNYIDANDIELYPNQTVTATGYYGPANSGFALSNLTIKALDDTDKLLTISKKSVNAAKTSFTFSVKCKNVNLTEDKIITLELSYVEGEKTFTKEIKVTIHKLLELRKSNITDASIVSEYNANAYVNSYYGADELVIESITIKIPYESTVTKNAHMYDKNQYNWETDNISVTNKSYNSITIKLKTTDHLEGQIKYYPNKNYTDEYYTFSYKYSIKEDDSHITNILFNKVYTTDEDGVNNLFLGEEYENLFTYSIQSSGSTTSSIFAKTDIIVEVKENPDEAIELVYEGTKVKGIIAKNLGSAVISVTSAYETEIDFANKIIKEIEFTVTNAANTTYVYKDGEVIEDLASEIVINKDDEIVLDYRATHLLTFKDGTSFEYDIPEFIYTFELSNEEFALYNTYSKIFKGIVGGNVTIKFIPVDEALSYLTKQLSIKIDHTPVSASSMKMTFEALTDPNSTLLQFNKYSEDFSKVPENFQFQINTTVNEDATNKEVKYLSQNPDIISITDRGLAEAKKAGKATIVAYSVDDPTISISKTITVTTTSSPIIIDEESLGAESFSVKNYNGDENTKVYTIKLFYGKSYRIRLVPLYECSSTSFTTSYVDLKNPDNKDIKKNARIDKAGNITMTDIGETTIKITFGDKDTISKYSAYVTIKVERDLKYSFNQLANLVRKLMGHYGLFLLTALSGIPFIFLTWKKRKRDRVIALAVYTVIGFAIAVISELVIQQLTPGRGPTWRDVGIDFGGYCTTIGIAYICMFLAYFFQVFLKKMKEKRLAKKGITEATPDNIPETTEPETIEVKPVVEETPTEPVVEEKVEEPKKVQEKPSKPAKEKKVKKDKKVKKTKDSEVVQNTTRRFRNKKESSVNRKKAKRKATRKARKAGKR